MHRQDLRSAFDAITPTRCFSVWLLLAISVPAEAQVPRLWGDLRAGPSSVGYRVVRLFDDRRTFGARPANTVPGAPAPNQRLMTLRIWYPAAAVQSAARMTLRSYLDLDDEDGPITAAVRERRELDLNGIWADLCTCRLARTAADARFGALLSTTGAAVRWPRRRCTGFLRAR